MNNPSFDTWTIIFFLAAIQGIFLSLVIFFSRGKMKNPNKLLGVFVLLFSLTLLDYFSYWSNYRFVLPHLFGFSFGFPFLFGPLLFWYIGSLHGKLLTFKSVSLQLLPALAYYLYRAPYFQLSTEEKLSLFQEGEPYSSWVLLILLGKFTHMILYSFLAYREIKSGTSIPKIAMKWQMILIGLFVIFILSNATYYILINTINFHIEYDYMISLSMAIAIYSIGYLGYRHPEILHGFEMARGKYERSSLEAFKAEELIGKLERLMTEDHIYRENSLKMGQVAKLLETTQHHISQAINEKTGLTFPEMVNTYRINEAKEWLADPDKKSLNIIEIAYSVGFNNKANFNHAFKRQTGVSPSEYRKLHSNEIKLSQAS